MAYPEIQSQEPYAPYRFTVDEFYRMSDVDILRNDEHVELLDGRLVVKEPPGPPHAAHLGMLNKLLVLLLGDRAVVRPQDPFGIDELNHPEPDLAIVKPRDDFYAAAHPGPDDALLLVEIAWSSAPGDRVVKAPLYAAAGIQEFWLVDIKKQSLEVYREPSPEGYRRYERLGREDTLSPLAFPDLDVAVCDVVRPILES